jgi:hypothetical protein
MSSGLILMPMADQAQFLAGYPKASRTDAGTLLQAAASASSEGSSVASIHWVGCFTVKGWPATLAAVGMMLGADGPPRRGSPKAAMKPMVEGGAFLAMNISVCMVLTGLGAKSNPPGLPRPRHLCRKAGSHGSLALRPSTASMGGRTGSAANGASAKIVQTRGANGFVYS